MNDVLDELERLGAEFELPIGGGVGVIWPIVPPADRARLVALAEEVARHADAYEAQIEVRMYQREHSSWF